MEVSKFKREIFLTEKKRNLFDRKRWKKDLSVRLL